VEDLPRKGRKRKLSEFMRKRIIELIERNPTMSCKEIYRKLGGGRLNFTYRTVLRFLKSEGFKFQIPTKKPAISAKQMKARLIFARKYLNYNWNQVLFSDEKTFYQHGWRRKMWADNLIHWILYI